MTFGAATIGASAATAPYAFVSSATHGLELKDTLAGWMCDPWERSLRALEALFGLQDDWDGEGAAAPDSANVETALRLVALVRRTPGVLPPPQVVPGGNGEVILAWHEGDLYWEAECATPGMVEWMLTASGRPAKHWITDLATRTKPEPRSASGRPAEHSGPSQATTSPPPSNPSTQALSAAASLAPAA